MDCVIGSGPAGVACAVSLVRAGREVLMLDAGIELEGDIKASVKKLQQQPYENWNAKTIESFKDKFACDARGVQVKYTYGSDFPYREVGKHIPISSSGIGHVPPTLAQGGFSTVWGSAMLPFLANEISDWPISLPQLEPHYRNVLSFVPLAGAKDDLENFFPLHSEQLRKLPQSQQAAALFADLTVNRSELNRQGLYYGSSRLAVTGNNNGNASTPEQAKFGPSERPACERCGLCLYGCPLELIYSTGHTLQYLLKHQNFRYQPNTIVRRISEAAGKVEIEAVTRDSGQPLKVSADAAFLGAGTISSTRIVLESLGTYHHPLEIVASEYFMVPLLRYAKTKGVTSERLHTLAQIFLECFDSSISEHSVHMQIYSYSDLYQRALRSMAGVFEPLLRLVEGEILGRMLFIQGYLHSDLSSRISLHLEPGQQSKLVLKGKVNPAASPVIKKVIKKLWQARGSGRFLVVPPMLKIGFPGDGRHIGGTFPMSNQPSEFQSDTMGRPRGFEKLFLIDSSTFPSIPASTITFTIMANAQRIASAYLEQQGIKQ